MSTNKVIAIPEDIVNPKEYLKWVALSKHPILRNPIQLTSEGDEINVANLPHRFKKAIEHLSPKEQEDLLDIKSQWMRMNAKANTAKAMAWGRMGCYGGKKKEVARVKISPFEEDIVELLGRMFTIAEVVKILGEDMGVIVDEDDVKRVLKKHVVDIERKREEFRNKISDVRLYNKRPRLDELSWMYSKMKTKFIAVNTVDSYNAMLRTLEQIRKEAEGDVINIQGSMDINVNATIQMHIQKEILRTINLKEIILGRVAARMNADLGKLVQGLHNSYYSKFVEISGDYDPEAEMQYPSSMAYDFTKIEASAGKEVVDITAVPITETEKTSAQRTKELFLNKIRKQKEEMESRQTAFDFRAEEKQSRGKEDFDEVKRPVGRGKDKIPPSATSAGKIKNKGKDYYTGEKK